VVHEYQIALVNALFVILQLMAKRQKMSEFELGGMIAPLIFVIVGFVIGYKTTKKKKAAEEQHGE